jgi:uncharacterized protein YggE
MCACVAFSLQAEAFFPPAVSCDLKGTATVNITFNGSESDVSAIKAKFDSKIEEANSLAKEIKMDKPMLQSMNYNINPQYDNGSMDSFQFNGNATFRITPLEKASDYMSMLVKKGFHASLNVNSYRNAMCNQSTVSSDHNLE